jgi:ubiquinone/menaquinone biosynthesis C-methylase UbiE
MFLEPEKNISQFHVDPGMKVADFGAGTGYYAFLLSSLVGPSGKIYALDVQKDLLNKLKKDAIEKKLDNIEVIWADLDEINGTTLEAGYVDRVAITNSLFQMENKDNTITEAYRILKPKGKLLVIDWSDSYNGLGPKPSDVLKPDAARVLCEHCGFVFEKEINAGDHHYGFIFKKN